MEKIYSKVDPELLLHVIIRKEDATDKRNDISPEEDFLQLAVIKFPKGKTFRLHYHIWKDAPKYQVITQESWAVMQGKVKAILYDTDHTLLAEPILKAGDGSITFQGAHNYEILEDDTIIFEYKTGPYKGVENDKVFLS